ncbi:MAG: hypothetical protein A2X94_16700 [Bdellovibrionales bacterium GWB1_55_8]|nr:MAG: hypothetical protein A2X94_16700 [Bdellovibrionales bacterium GWB1_55_8]
MELRIFFLRTCLIVLLPFAMLLSSCNGDGDKPTGAPDRNPATATGITISDDELPSDWSQARLRADKGILSWDVAERLRLGAVAPNALVLFPFDSNSPVLGWYPENRIYQYGQKFLVFDVRRAATYLELVYPAAAAPLLGDLSQQDGATPADAAGLRHPAGSHVSGLSVDLSYLGRDGIRAPVTLEDLDVDANAWFLYALFESASVGTIITAYKDAFVSRAEDWYAAGLISFEALIRFRNDLWQDATLNHWGHMHVNSSNRAGIYSDTSQSLYRCYRATSGSYGVIWARVGC